jgi:hypothetical protein
MSVMIRKALFSLACVAMLAGCSSQLSPDDRALLTEAHTMAMAAKDDAARAAQDAAAARQDADKAAKAAEAASEKADRIFRQGQKK